MRNRLFSSGAMLALCAVSTASAAPMQPPPPTPSPVTETLYGQTVTDTYRGMEAMGPATVDWMKAEGRYTRGLLGSIQSRAELVQRIAAFSASLGPVKDVEVYGGRTFYLERAAGSDNFDLMVRSAQGESRKLVDLGKLQAAHGGIPYAIDYYTVSPDGARVGVGISTGGSEDASLFVYDVASGAQIAEPLDRAESGGLSWSDDGRTLFLIRQQKTDDPQLKEASEAVQVWNLKGEPRDVMGAPVTQSRVKMTPLMHPALGLTPGSPIAVAQVSNGVQREQEIWTAPRADASSPTAPWTRIAVREDDVTAIAVRGDDLYLMSHKDAPTFKVLHVKAGQSIATADVVLPARPDRLIEGISAASDGLYVQAREGVYSKLLFVPADGGAVRDILLPAKGSVNAVLTDPRRPGAVIRFESWLIPSTFYAWNGAAFANLQLGAKPPFDPKAYAAVDLKAKAKDGVEVPLTYLSKAGAKRPGVVLMTAYGSYGVSSFPGFGSRSIPFLDEGAALATCNVRGGGELGEAWRLGGKDANKPNTWRDLIACGHALVAQGYTTPNKLFIIGTSAGGIPLGRALEEAPKLFAGGILLSPAVNTLRLEFSPNGPPNTPEFGTIKTEAGFKNLFAMDSVQQVEKGAQYPAVMVAIGLNDPWVPPWVPGKLAASLMASGTSNPVLLRVEEQGGHGSEDMTKSQADALYADFYAFVFWRAGWPGWVPGS